MITRTFLAALLAILSLGGGTAQGAARVPEAAPPLYRFVPPGDRAVKLKLVGHLPRAVNESSAFLQSRTQPGVYWTLNDSGDVARLFPVDARGNLLRHPETPGIFIANARNVDWEALAADDNGNLYIGDLGNNLGRRQELHIYVVPEPPLDARQPVEANRTLTLRYADAAAGSRNHDGEALVFARGALWVFTKHWEDTETTVYRIDPAKPGTQVVQPVCRFDSYGQVTDASLSRDGRRLALLTYKGIWLLDWPETAATPFETGAQWLCISAGQCEGISWRDAETLLVTNEGHEVFEAKVSQFKPCR